MIRAGLVIVLALILGDAVFGQDDEKQVEKQPVIRPPAAINLNAIPLQRLRAAAAVSRNTYPTLRQVTRVKLDIKDAENKKLIVMVQKYRVEKQPGEQLITKTRAEQRTREVVVDGKKVEQIYTVMVPYTEKVTGREVRVPAGLKPEPYDLSLFTFYDIQGDPLTEEQLTDRLAQLTPVFMIERFRRTFEGVPEPQRTMLRPDAIVITTDASLSQLLNEKP